MRERLGVARDEAVHLAAPDLEVDGAAGVIGIVLDHRAVEMVDRIVAPVVLVGELRPQTIDIAATTLEREIPQHVVEGAILEHQDDDVVDLPEVGHAALLSEPGRGDVVLNASHLDESTKARARPLLTAVDLEGNAEIS